MNKLGSDLKYVLQGFLRGIAGVLGISFGAGVAVDEVNKFYGAESKITDTAMEIVDAGLMRKENLDFGESRATMAFKGESLAIGREKECDSGKVFDNLVLGGGLGEIAKKEEDSAWFRDAGEETLAIGEAAFMG